MFIRSSILAVFLVLVSFAAAQRTGQATHQPGKPGPPTEEDLAQAEAARTAQATINWDKASSPGIKVRLELLKKGMVNGKAMVDYRVKVEGAPHDKLYKLTIWPVTVANPLAMMDGLAIGTDGTVMCPADSDKSCAQRFKGKEVHLTYSPEIGEIFRQALISEDNQSRIFFSMVPAPIVQNDKSCSLEAVRLSPSFELALVRGKGFTPGEQLSVHTQSYQEVHSVPAKADAQGEFFLSITPSVKGRTSGVIEISAKGAACSPVISFNWGL
ncbi:MAG TPA: hypothetical protein VF532_15015 [Candidatus Angelobacter sp.]